MGVETRYVCNKNGAVKENIESMIKLEELNIGTDKLIREKSGSGVDGVEDGGGRLDCQCRYDEKQVHDDIKMIVLLLI